MADAHNRTRYTKGCHCDVCTRANTEYNQKRRAARREAAAAGNVTPKPTAIKGGSKPRSTPAETTQIPYKESVTAAVKAELETYVGAETRPALAAMALALARVLDTPSALPQHAAAVGKLEGLLTTIAKHGVKQESTLSKMRAELKSA